MDMQELIGRCQSHGIELEVHAGALEMYFDEDPPEDLLDLLRQHKGELLALLGRQDAADLVAGRAGAGWNPMSFAQQRLWLLDQMEGGSPHYNLFSAFAFDGSFDEQAAEAAFTALVARHEPLRTVYAEVDGAPCQRVLAQAPFVLLREDLGRLAAAEREQAVAAALAEEAGYTFQLASDLMLRAVCLRTAADAGILMINMHHIAADGWSQALLIDEFVRLYRHHAALDGAQAQLAPLPLRYADYAGWQRERLDGAFLQQQLGYWKQQLADLPQVHSLPLDRPRPPLAGLQGASVRMRLPAASVGALTRLAQAHQATLFMALHALFSVLLARYGRNGDVVLGTPVAGRARSELEGLVGLFANTLVLRTEVDGELPFGTYLERVRDVDLAAQEHQELPFELLVESLNPARSPSHAPLFQVLFALNSTPAGTLELPGLRLRPLPAPAAAKYDLSLQATPDGAALDLRFEYDTALFEADTVERLARHFLQLAEAAIADPGCAVGRLPMSDADERAQLLDAAHGPVLAPTDAGAMHQLFERQAAATPDARALVCGERALSYAQLDRLADRYAAALRARGAGPGTLVGVCVERSAEMVAALLGILKAGAAYLPLDPAYPAARLRYMLEDSGAPIVLTESALGATLGATAASLVCIDLPDFRAELDAAGPAPAAAVAPSDLAYVIYTSGSTGQPKGVMVEHRSVLAFLAAVRPRLGGREAVWLGLTAISFDISILEIFGALSSGAQLVLAQDADAVAAPARPLEFSLFYFASSAGVSGAEQYRLLLEGARFADDHGFAAVWTPERHFAPFGGIFPNPAVTGAAVAALTKRVQIRAGSCVLPLNDPLKVAEDWSVIDNLSQGRVGLAFASGWNPNDFALAPENFARRHQVLFDGVEQFRRFWRGEPVRRTSGTGAEIDVHLYPRPVQELPPIWITAAGSEHTFRSAGQMGARVLTHLLGQTVGELADKIAAYRKAWRDAGHPGEGHVTLMVHTFVAATNDEAAQLVRQPFKQYLATSLALINAIRDENAGAGLDEDAILDLACNRYFNSAALFGSSEHCAARIRELLAAGVSELACLIDFGVAADAVLASLPRLAALKERINRPPADPVGTLIERHGVTHMQCTPSRATLLLDDPVQRAQLAGLEAVLLGGEACPPALVEQLAQATGASIHNMYGPTEATVWASCQQLQAGEAEAPIGRALGHCQLYVADPCLNLAPLGVPGELLIAGPALARGYLGREALTAERFVQFRPGSGPALRAYRTGDLVRQRADGTLHFLGRIDSQVKLRGFRVELGEIETQLLLHPGVKAAAAVVRDWGGGDQRLLAYVVPSGAEERSRLGAMLRTHLGLVLPDYMVPSNITILEALPLTANGKLDRKALPAPEASASAVRTLPSSATEHALVAIWAGLLKLAPEQIGTEANFFELGGHSLLLMRQVAEIRSRCGVELSVREVFELPSLAQLALRIEQRQQADADLARFDRLQGQAQENEQEVVL